VPRRATPRPGGCCWGSPATARGKARFAEGTDDRGAGGVKRLKLDGEVTRLGVPTLRRGKEGWKALVPDELRHYADYAAAQWKEK
jgi:hypothetical protein